MRDRRWLAIVAFGWGCGGAAPQPGDASLRLGSSPEGFHALEEGGTLEVFQGPQGGFHVFLGLRAAGVTRAATVDFDVVDLDGDRLLDRFVPLRLELVPSGEAPGALDLPPR